MLSFCFITFLVAILNLFSSSFFYVTFIFFLKSKAGANPLVMSQLIDSTAVTKEMPGKFHEKSEKLHAQ